MVGKDSTIDFLVKHQMSPAATYSDINCGNKVLNHEWPTAIKIKKSPNGNLDNGNRNEVIILGDSLLSSVNEKILSRKHNV